MTARRVASITLFCLFGICWFRSVFVSDSLRHYEYGGRFIEVESNSGALYVEWGSEINPMAQKFTDYFHFEPHVWEEEYGIPGSRLFGVHYFYLSPPKYGEYASVVVVSYWLPMVFLLLIGGVDLLRKPNGVNGEKTR
jgi:hypothetical protein